MAIGIFTEYVPDVHGAKLIADGERALAVGDSETACRMAWSAVEGGLKAAAARRGWKYDGGAGIYEIVDRLEAESGETDFKLFFLVAENLRENIYIDSTPTFAIEYEIGKVKEFLAMLERAG